MATGTPPLRIDGIPSSHSLPHLRFFAMLSRVGRTRSALCLHISRLALSSEKMVQGVRHFASDPSDLVVLGHMGIRPIYIALDLWRECPMSRCACPCRIPSSRRKTSWKTSSADLVVQTAVDSPGSVPKAGQGSSGSGENGPWAMETASWDQRAVARLAGYRYSWEPGARLVKSLSDSFHGSLARVAACSKEEVC